MQTWTDLKNLLARIDRRGYPAYKDTRGAWQFPGYVLSIDHVQGDPFAAPSKVSIHIKGAADIVASELGISRTSIYNYLRSIKDYPAQGV